MCTYSLTATTIITTTDENKVDIKNGLKNSSAFAIYCFSVCLSLKSFFLA